MLSVTTNHTAHGHEYQVFHYILRSVFEKFSQRNQAATKVVEIQSQT